MNRYAVLAVAGDGCALSVHAEVPEELWPFFGRELDEWVAQQTLRTLTCSWWATAPLLVTVVCRSCGLVTFPLCHADTRLLFEHLSEDRKLYCTEDDQRHEVVALMSVVERPPEEAHSVELGDDEWPT